VDVSLIQFIDGHVNCEFRHQQFFISCSIMP
jgi:hypothetical protein